jgi:hypothetical protein
MTALMTHVNIPDAPFRFGYQSKFFFIGSCFADAIGRRMKDLKFSACHNPFGVVYNPLSMAANLQYLLDKECFGEEDIEFYNELWFSYAHYTLFSDVDKQQCLENINKTFIAARDFIHKADVLILTLGTSWVYELKETGRVVANCHKIPSGRFNRYFSSSGNSANHLQKVIQNIREVNPSVKVIFTVSPVRHWKDGAIENQRSKAALVLAVANLQQEMENIYYFPAYEIFMDELRDYRFYAPDMIHPSDQAVEYTWKKFANTFLSEECHTILNNVESIQCSVKHKPRHSNTLSHRHFVDSILAKIEEFNKHNPDLNFNIEIEELKKCLNNLE